MSSRETRIKTFKDLKEYFQEGSKCMIHCAIVGRSSLVSYRHHYIVLGHTWCSVCESIEIIHFSASANESSNGKVLKETYSKKNLEEDIQNGLYIIENDAYPKNEEQYGQALARFQERENKENYCVMKNNCEHLVNYILTGEHTSDQIKEMGAYKKVVAYVCNSSLSSNQLVPSSLSGASAECSRRNPPPSAITCKSCGRNLPSSSSVTKRGISS